MVNPPSSIRMLREIYPHAINEIFFLNIFFLFLGISVAPLPPISLDYIYQAKLQR
jgi:hypothetical protein